MDRTELERRLALLLQKVGLDPAKPPRYPWPNRMDEQEAERRIRLLEERYK